MIKKHSEIIILAIIWIVSIYSLTVAIFKNYEIGIPNYIGYGLLIAVSVLTVLKIKKIKTVLGIFLLIGSINLFQFTHSTVTLAFTLSIFGNGYSSIGLQPLSLALLIFFLVVNHSDLTLILKKLFAPDPNTEMERKQNVENKFYEQMKSKPDNYLMEIAGRKNDYQPEFVNAAKKVIDERKINKTAP